MTTSAKTIRAVAAFIPSNIARQLAQGKTFAPGQELPDQGVALFADIAGFTPMAEQLVNLMKTTQNGDGHRGAEELNRIINKTFTAIIRPIHANGGVVTRFSGDALAAFFPDSDPKTPQKIIQRVLQCALQMQAAIAPLSKIVVEGHTFPISIKIGLSYGPVLTIFLGHGKSYKEIVLVGPALDNATLAEHHANRGDIILAPGIVQQFPNCPCQPTGKGYAKLSKALETLLPPCPTPDLLEGVTPAVWQNFLSALSPYLPNTVFKRVLMTQGDIPGDYRRVANTFVLFEGLDYTQAGVGQQLQRYIEWAWQTVTRFEGTLLRVLTGDKGSGLHITFGAPDQHPNDIERALRCALALRDDPKRPDFIVSQKIGLASGLVFTAAIGSPERREYTVMGNEINLSARLMTATDPESILVDLYSQQRTAHRFEFSALPPLTLKGKSEPVTAYRLLSERPVETGLEARFLGSRWPIVGRQEELNNLKQASNLALKGEGQVIALSGKLGVGKTRLIEETVRYWLNKGGDGFMGQCNQHLQNNPYQAWIGFWHNFFRLPPQSTPKEQRDKITELTGLLAPNMLPWIDALGEILGLPLPENSPLRGLNAETRRQKLYQFTLALLEGRAGQRPLLILFEDLHWIDEASADLIDYVAERISDAPILLCYLFRSSHDVPVASIALPHAIWRTLEDLQAKEIEPLMQAILGSAIIPAEIVRDMFDRTQGTPLYVEEIISNLLAANALHFNGKQYIFKDPGQLAKIPDTLQDLVRARLDRLETETHDLAQVAAVVDREFTCSLLKDVYPYPLPDEQLRNRLDELHYEDITTLTQPEPGLSYFFKQSLTHQIAYESLAFARRQSLHKQIARAIEHRYAKSIEEHYSSLAYHYHQAGDFDQALRYTIEIGERAQRLYANKTALEHYRQAETYLKKLPLEKYHQLAARLHLNRAQLHRLNFDMPAAQSDLDAALTIAQTYKDTHSQAQAHNLKAEFAYYQEQAGIIWKEAEQALKLAKKRKLSRQKATALYHLGVSDMMGGQFDRSMRFLKQAYTMALKNHYPALESEALNKIALVNFFDGHLNWALKAYQKVYSSRSQLGLKDKEAETLSNIATVQFRLNNLAQAYTASQKAIERAEEAGWQLLIPYVKLLQVELLAHQGRYAQAESVMSQTYALFAPDDPIGNAYAKLTHGREILLDLSRLDETVSLLKESLAVMQKHNNYEETARALVSLGVVASRQKRWTEAETYFTQAQRICLERHKSWYLAEIYTRLSESLLKQENLAGALKAVKKGLNAVKTRSNPDWYGPLLTLSADIAGQQGRAEAEVTKLYLTAMHHVRARGRTIGRNRLFIHIGTQLLSSNNPEIRKQAENLILEGMAWLQEQIEAIMN
ncbi:MAG: hypothetical protein B6243_00070 [Anaerolineaceae bacterium 4572_5.2]|nr:MAG: hypothetical protein B6243_00070 [Anaerolineaceae bacterium 4572_5.2]